MSYNFRKLGERLFLANFTDYADINRSLNEGNDIIAGCIDNRRQKPVAVGDYYHSDDCTICLCSPTERLCKQISCAPPTKCDGFIRKDPLHCCDICMPATILERPNDESSLNTKLGALTVTLFLIVSLILFTFHRLRRKRVLITLRRLQSLRRQEAGCSALDREDGFIEVYGGATVLRARSHLTGVDQFFVNGYAFPEAPPAYSSVVRTIPNRTPASLAVTVADRPPSYNSVARPRRPSPKPLSSVLNRTLSSLLPAATTALFNRRRRFLGGGTDRNSQNNGPGISASTQNGASHNISQVPILRINGESGVESEPAGHVTHESSIAEGGAMSTVQSSSTISACRESLNSTTDSESDESSSAESGDVSSSSTCCCSMCEDEAEDHETFLAPHGSHEENTSTPFASALSTAVPDSIKDSVSIPKRYNNVSDNQAPSEAAENRLCSSCRVELASCSSAAEPSTSRPMAAPGPSKLALKSTILRQKQKILCKRKIKSGPAAVGRSKKKSVLAAKSPKRQRKVHLTQKIPNSQSNVAHESVTTV